MNDEELRSLVRAALARRAETSSLETSPHIPAVFHHHPSHGMMMLPTGADGDGPCIIEPAVMCSHCGYCKSYGH